MGIIGSILRFIIPAVSDATDGPYRCRPQRESERGVCVGFRSVAGNLFFGFWCIYCLFLRLLLSFLSIFYVDLFFVFMDFTFCVCRLFYVVFCLYFLVFFRFSFLS